MTSETTVIETRNLSVYYGRRRGVHDLNLGVQSGEVYGFLGPNGAGKTTALRVLLDVIRPTAGAALVFGLDCQVHSVRIRRQIGYIPGELSLYPTLRADEYFRMVNDVRGKTATPEDVSRLCERLDLDPTRPMRSYSRGNKQKVGLVAALMGEPELLILDEPTSGLDPLVQQTVLNLVREARSEGRTAFFSSHVLSEVQTVCDRVGIIRAGRLVATERIDTLTRGTFHRLSVRFERMPQPRTLDGKGVREISRSDDAVTFEIKENLNAFLARAVHHGVLDLDTEHISLDEAFMAYYGAEGDDD